MAASGRGVITASGEAYDRERSSSRDLAVVRTRATARSRQGRGGSLTGGALISTGLWISGFSRDMTGSVATSPGNGPAGECRVYSLDGDDLLTL
jgi:hypothetical protein